MAKEGQGAAVGESLKVSEDQRQGWPSIALVWAGAMICVSSLMVGASLGAGMTLSLVLVCVLVGYGLVTFIMSLIGIEGCDMGVPTAALAGGALGEKGGRYVIAIILGVSCIGWFGVQAGVCGASFAALAQSFLGLGIPVWAASVFWGLVMLATACFGFAGLKWLNYIAVPLLLIACGAAAWMGVLDKGGVEVLTSYVPAADVSFMAGINMVVGSFAVGAAIASDFCRFARSRADVVKSSILGVLPAGLLMLVLGAVMSITSGGEYDISKVLSVLGLPLLGLTALVLAAWTTNVSNAYSGGLALSVLLGLDERRSRIATAIAGGVGTLLAAVGIINYFSAFLSLLSAFVPVCSGVMIASYWIVGRGKKENFRVSPGFSMPGMVSFIAGSIVACVTGGVFGNFPALVALAPWLNVPFFIGPVNGMVVAIVLFVVLTRLCGGASDASASSSDARAEGSDA